jgi:hypothetical protein
MGRCNACVDVRRSRAGAPLVLGGGAPNSERNKRALPRVDAALCGTIGKHDRHSRVCPAQYFLVWCQHVSTPVTHFYFDRLRQTKSEKFNRWAKTSVCVKNRAAWSGEGRIHAHSSQQPPPRFLGSSLSHLARTEQHNRSNAFFTFFCPLAGHNFAS